MEIERYDSMLFDEWDIFVREESVNGTFLQTRKFLSYHPKERFKDCSLVIRDREKIVAVCPACEMAEVNGKSFISHLGSTYGGLVLSPRINRTEKIIKLIYEMEQFLKENNFEKCVLKITPAIFCRDNFELLDFILNKMGYRENQELNLYIDFQKYNYDILKNFHKGRKACVKQCLKRDMRFVKATLDSEIKEFYHILCDTLKKYDKVPVHSLEELFLLRDLLKEEVSFWTVLLEDRIIGGTMLFHFKEANLLHTQYLAVNNSLEEISPMSFLYYSIIEYAKSMSYKYLSWGIATDHEANLNMGLIYAKESVGSKHTINRIFVKEFLR